MVDNNLTDENIGYVENILWGKKNDVPTQSVGELASDSSTEGADCEAIGEGL